MPTLRQIKRKIQSVKNTAQITKAMEAVAATKMRRAQEVALRSRPYALSCLKILASVSQTMDSRFRGNDMIEIKKHFLLKKRKDKKICLMVVSADRGLCGAYNSNIFKKIISSNLNLEAFDFVAVGKKASEWLKRKNYKIAKEFAGAGDYISILQSRPIANFLMEGYKSRYWSQISACFTNFKTTLKQEAVTRQILPFKKETIEEIIKGIAPEYGKYSDISPYEDGLRGLKEKYNFEYKFEPSSKEVLDKLLPELFETLIYHLILESNASEHSSRMVAMKNASDNATKILDILRLNYNKARQAAITKEITEIVSGVEAMAA